MAGNWNGDEDSFEGRVGRADGETEWLLGALAGRAGRSLAVWKFIKGE